MSDHGGGHRAVESCAYARRTAPAATALLRATPADFRVDEDCAIAPTGAGEHLWCRIEKTDITTADVVATLSRNAGVHPRDIGYAGVKDRRAVARQWLSLAWPIARELPSAAALAGDSPGLTILDMARHERKLKRGAHASNRFVIRLCELCGERCALEADLERVRDHGVPNYFGAQRFGRGGRNLVLARRLFDGARLSRNRRGFALSAARSLIFNQVLDRRVRKRTWNRIIDGEAIMLDGSHSVFAQAAAGQSAAELAARIEAFDIHPSGPLPGVGGADVVAGDAAALEAEILDAHPVFTAGLIRFGVDAARRALRLNVRDLTWSFDDDASLTVSFRLEPGAFATSVLRELVKSRETEP